MRYQSNLIAPDIEPYFRLLDPPMQHMGHDVPSDPDFLPECGFMTHDEAAILYHIAKAWPKRWVDIGARLGWSAAHISSASEALTVCVDPELIHPSPFFERWLDNSAHFPWSRPFCGTSEDFFKCVVPGQTIDAACIDGNHDTPEPVAWRDGCGFVPPDHVPDPAIDWREIQARYTDFDFGRCE